MKRFLNQVGFIAGIEARFFVRFPKLLYATAAVALIPALYAIIYLSSLWDPESHSHALAVAVVNLDQGVEYRAHRFNVGTEVLVQLKARQTFGYVDYTDEAAARRDVRQGLLAFALIIPQDFSSNAVPGATGGSGRLVVYTSAGNNYESATLARHFAQELGHEVNERLNEQRWELVLTNAVGSRRSLEGLRDGVNQLRSGVADLANGATATAKGAQELAKGTDRLSAGVTQASTGFKQLGAGVRAMDAQRPRNSDLRRLQSGAEALVAGHTELGHGLTGLETATQRLQGSITEFRDEARDSLLIPSRVADGANQLAGGVTQIHSGLRTARNGQQKLADGAAELSAGVGTAVTGMRAFTDGIRAMASQLPQDEQLDALSNGSGELAGGAKALAGATLQVKTGTQQLEAGIGLLADSLPATIQSPEGSAQGLANSVSPQVEVTAVVQNNGSGFAPNVIPAALWLGASIAAFLIHVRVLPRHAQFFARPAQLLGKLLMPSLVVLVQALLVLLTVLYILKIRVVNPAPFALTLGVASLTFLLFVFALTRAFGDAGKALSMIFLAIQLSSSGGIIPVELSGGLFSSISPWLPLTWVVRAIKASMFGAYDGNWLHPLLMVTLAAMLAGTAATFVGRWRFVKHSTIRPAIDF